jgi:hypothetical protein
MTQIFSAARQIAAVWRHTLLHNDDPRCRVRLRKRGVG